MKKAKDPVQHGRHTLRKKALISFKEGKSGNRPNLSLTELVWAREGEWEI